MCIKTEIGEAGWVLFSWTLWLRNCSRESQGLGLGQSEVFKPACLSNLLKQEVAFCPEHVESDLWKVQVHFGAKLQGGSTEACFLVAKLVLLPFGCRMGLSEAIASLPLNSSLKTASP